MVKLPTGWSLSTLPNLMGTGGLCKDGDWVESQDQDPGGEIRLVQLADIGDGHFLDKSSRFLNIVSGERLGITKLVTGDILIARMPFPLGRACQFPKVSYTACTVVDVLIFRSGHKSISHKWLMHFINSPQIREKMEQLSGGSTRKRISGGNLKKMDFPIPPQNEQIRIAEKIDNLFERIGNTRQITDIIPALLDQYRQSTLIEAFSGKLTKKWRDSKPIQSDTDTSLRENKSQNEGIPVTWRVDTVGSIIDKIQSGKSFKCIERPPQTGGKGIVKVSAVSWGTFDENESKTVTDVSRLNEKAKINEGDLLFSRANTIELVGACLIVGKFTKDLYLSDKILRLDVPAKYKVYLKWFLKSPDGRKQIEAMATGAQHSMRNISQSSLKSIVMPFPDEEEIQIINHTLENVEKLLNQISSRMKELYLKLNLLEKSILAKAFRGELVPQDTSDEPAVKLLRRITAECKKLDKELENKKRIKGKTVKKEAKKMVISVVNALKQSEKPLTAQQLLFAAGYPSNASTDQVEEFFLDIRRSLTASQIIVQREDQQDYFRLAG